ncbi:hypothetical protein [Micromonospora ureilytica]|uniref:hypothetical protein n=1 Tax=Micromonospora ureilytica TaxID=709868 RepID=UPI002E0E3B68|nr:hypothetical protein OHB55_02505 [Micromonospora ureilytica]
MEHAVTHQEIPELASGMASTIARCRTRAYQPWAGETLFFGKDATVRVSYNEYVLVTALTLARRHRPVWSWTRWRTVCRCGAELPCRARHRIPINRGHWPT